MASEQDRRLSSAVNSILQPMLSDTYVSPRPASRVGTSTDAAKYMRRNRGSSSLWLAKRCGSVELDNNEDEDEFGAPTARGCQTARGPRLSGEEASEIFRRSHQGSVGMLMDEKNQSGYSSPRPQPRLTNSEAEENARRSAGMMRQLLDAQSSTGLGPPQRRILTAEAEANAARNAGTMNQMMNPSCDNGNKNVLAIRLEQTTGRKDAGDTPRPPRQRVKPEAEDNARKNAGTTCAAVLMGRLPGDPVREVRVSGTGRENYEASRQGSVGALFAKYGQQAASTDHNPAPERIPQGPGKEFAKHGKTGTLCFLMSSYGTLPRSPRPASRLHCEGKRYVCRNSGNNMSKCLNQASKPRRRARSACARKSV